MIFIFFYFATARAAYNKAIVLLLNFYKKKINDIDSMNDIVFERFKRYKKSIERMFA